MNQNPEVTDQEFAGEGILIEDNLSVKHFSPHF